MLRLFWLVGLDLGGFAYLFVLDCDLVFCRFVVGWDIVWFEAMAGWMLYMLLIVLIVLYFRWFCFWLLMFG